MSRPVGAVFRFSKLKTAPCSQSYARGITNLKIRINRAPQSTRLLCICRENKLPAIRLLTWNHAPLQTVWPSCGLDAQINAEVGSNTTKTDSGVPGGINKKKRGYRAS